MESILNITQNKSTMRIFAGLTLLILLLSIFAPNLSFADPATSGDAKTADGLNKFGVTMESNGTLKYEGMDTKSWTDIIGRYRVFIIGGTGIATVTLVGAFVVSLTKLGASAGNPQARAGAITACLWTGIASALLGSATIIIGFFFNSLA